MKAERIVARLDREFAYHFHVEAVLWERLPLVATRHFQDEHNIPRASQADIVVVILWSRLGVLLPGDKFRGAVSGRPVTGTEWEFEDAYASARQNDVPDLLLYRKTARVSADLEDGPDLEARIEQKALVQDFIGRWFGADDKGGYSAASHTFENSSEFEEKLYEHLRELLERRAGARTEGVEIRWFGAPYRGLLSFEYEHAPVFFGRTRARNELRELLTRREERGLPFVLVMGASGSGKSSLIKAALLPDLMLPGMIGRVALVRYAQFRPSDGSGNLIEGLAAAISSPTALPELAGLGKLGLAESINGASVTLEAVLRESLLDAGRQANLAPSGNARLAILIDQLEELFTLETISPEQRHAFVRALDGLTRSGQVWVVATMRSDFYDRLETDPMLAKLAADDGIYRLLPLGDAELAQVIRQPAREAGLRFAIDAESGAGLDEVILTAATRDRGALPLLSFLLDQLWHRRSEKGELTFAAYEELGGLEGALGRRVEEVLKQEPQSDIDALRDAFIPHLVRLRIEDGKRVRQPAPLGSLPPASKRLVRLLIETRILTTRSDAGEPVVEVAHEALFAAWPKLSRWLDEEQVFLADLERIKAAYSSWLAAPAENKPDALLRGLLLTNARNWVAEYPQRFANAELLALRGYIEASAVSENAERARARKLRRTLIGALTAAVITFFFASLITTWQYRQAEAARATAIARLAEAQLNESRFLLGMADASWRGGQFELSGLTALAGLPKDMRAPERPLLPVVAARVAHAQATDRTLLLLSGHGSSMRDASYSPDGTRIVTGSGDGVARIWDARTGAELVQFVGHGESVNAVAWSPDGKRIVTGAGERISHTSTDNSLRLWDTQNGEELAKLDGHTDAVTSVAWSPDGARVASASSDKSVRLWDIKKGQEIAILLDHQSSVTHVAWSPDGNRLLTTSFDGTAKIWNSTSGAEILSIAESQISDAKWSPDGTRIVTTSSEGIATVRDAKTGSTLGLLKGHRRAVGTALFSPDSKHILTTSADPGAVIWDAATFTQIALLEGHRAIAESAGWSPDGLRVVTASGDGTARVWDARPERALVTLNGHEGPVRKIAWSPNGRRLVTASDDHTASVWDVATGRQVAVLEGHVDRIASAVWSPDGTRIVTAAADKTARIWNAESGRELRQLRGHTQNVTEAAWSPDGTRIATVATDNNGRLWNAETGEIIAVWEGAGAIAAPSWSPDGAWIATASVGIPLKAPGGIVHIWDGKTGARISALEGHSKLIFGLAWSPDSKRIVSTSWDYSARIWDPQTGRQTAVLNGHNGAVARAGWSPNGTRIVTASWDNTARIWDPETGHSLAILEGHTDSVWNARYSPDGKHILTTSRDGTSRVWDIDTSAAVAAIASGFDGEGDSLWSPDGSLIAIASGNKIARIWQTPAVGSTTDALTYASVSALRRFTPEERSQLSFGLVAGRPTAADAEKAAVNLGFTCDQLTSDPFDPLKAAVGVEIVNAVEAIDACKAALDRAPQEPRFMFQLARALYFGGKLDESLVYLQNAAARNYAAASDNLADRYLRGEGVVKDTGEALRLYTRAAQGGYLPAFADAGAVYWSFMEPAKRADALSWFRRGADRGDPFSHKWLAELTERGDGVPMNLEAALFHYVIEARLFEKYGLQEADVAYSRRGSIARVLPQQAAVRETYRAYDWKPQTDDVPAN